MTQTYNPKNIEPGYPGVRPAFGPDAARPMSRSSRRKLNRVTSRGGVRRS